MSTEAQSTTPEQPMAEPPQVQAQLAAPVANAEAVALADASEQPLEAQPTGSEPAPVPESVPAPAAPLPPSLAGTKVLILGLGDSGLAMARWCTRAGAQVQVWDSREAPPQAQALAADCPQAQRLHGALEPATQLQGLHRVLKSPGLAPHHEAIAPLLAAARDQGLLVQGELDLFVQGLAELKADKAYAPKLLAITGTNGKTTTTAMAGLLVGRTGLRTQVAGNIGPTLLDTLHASTQGPMHDDEGAALWPQVWVLELSSFQLEGGGAGVPGFEPHAATVLNISQDHLDWHGGMDAYAAAKRRVFGSTGVMVINLDDERVAAMAPAPAARQVKLRGFAAKAAEAKLAKAAAEGLPPPPPPAPPRTVQRFALQAPSRPGDFGLVQEGGMAWLVRALPADETHKPKPGEELELFLQRLMPADALRIRGRHNASNALAALALATAIGCPLAPMLHGLREYAGEPHRVQWVATVEAIDAYDDSKGTNVGATVAALKGLGTDKAPARLVIILGGDGKGQDFEPLLAPLREHARAVATIGRDAQAIETMITAGGGLAVPVHRHVSLQAATAWCFEQAEPGDAVLLSPACASLDMFRNYSHRAEVFVQAVQALANDRGQA